MGTCYFINDKKFIYKVKPIYFKLIINNNNYKYLYFIFYYMKLKNSNYIFKIRKIRYY
jgi:hypothetical protein